MSERPLAKVSVSKETVTVVQEQDVTSVVRETSTATDAGDGTVELSATREEIIATPAEDEDEDEELDISDLMEETGWKPRGIRNNPSETVKTIKTSSQVPGTGRPRPTKD